MDVDYFHVSRRNGAKAKNDQRIGEVRYKTVMSQNQNDTRLRDVLKIDLNTC